MGLTGMSSLAQTLVSWEEFLTFPERPDNGKRYELQDGEVVIVAAPKPIHIKLQKQTERLLERLTGERAVVTTEFPYRPHPNLQFWVADVACILRADWDTMPHDDYRIYSPPLIVEVQSPSNTPAKLNRQRIVALSAGTQEFWVEDWDKRTVEVTTLKATTIYRAGERIPVRMFDGEVAVDDVFGV